MVLSILLLKIENTIEKLLISENSFELNINPYTNLNFSKNKFLNLKYEDDVK